MRLTNAHLWLEFGCALAESAIAGGIGFPEDLRTGPITLVFAAAVGVVGFEVNLAVALVLGLAAWWGAVALGRRTTR